MLLHKVGVKTPPAVSVITRRPSAEKPVASLRKRHPKTQRLTLPVGEWKNPAPVNEGLVYHFAVAVHLASHMPLHFNIVAVTCVRARGRH